MGGKSTLRTRQKGKKAPTLAGLKKKAWKLLSELVRRSNADVAGYVRCYTCDEIRHWKVIQAAHAIPGRTGATLLDEEIIRPGCPVCNIWKRGNYPEFTARLIREKAKDVGEPNAEAVALRWWEMKLFYAKQVRKWSRSDLEAKCEEYRERLAALG